MNAPTSQTALALALDKAMKSAPETARLNNFEGTDGTRSATNREFLWNLIKRRGPSTTKNLMDEAVAAMPMGSFSSLLSDMVKRGQLKAQNVSTRLGRPILQYTALGEQYEHKRKVRRANQQNSIGPVSASPRIADRPIPISAEYIMEVMPVKQAHVLYKQLHEIFGK